jgi:hypothetical protein
MDMSEEMVGIFLRGALARSESDVEGGG